MSRGLGLTEGNEQPMSESLNMENPMCRTVFITMETNLTKQKRSQTQVEEVSFLAMITLQSDPLTVREN